MSIRVCFVALNAAPAIDPRIPGGVGGIETRSWLFARALARLPDFEVSFVVRHAKPLPHSVYENVRIVLLQDRLYAVRDSLVSRLKWSSRFPWIRLHQPRLSDLFYLPLLTVRKLLVGRPDPLHPSPFYETLDADLFLTFGVHSHSATVISSAQRAGKSAVLCLAHVGDLDARYTDSEPFINMYRDRSDICLWAIQHAGRILCQTAEQEQLLKERFERHGTVLANPIDLEEWDRLAKEPLDHSATSGLERYALWIGRADAEYKRPQLLLELARRCPEVRFLMIMNRRDDLLEAEVRRTAPDNVRIVERVPFPQMPALMQQAVMLVNTSSLEGFPNVFLQAAASGVPIASLVVEPEFLDQARAGESAGGDLDRQAAFIRDCWERPWPEENRRAAREFIENQHSLDAQTRRLGEFLREVQTAQETGAGQSARPPIR